MLSTPDGRYFVVKGQLWRCTNPALDEATRQYWVNELMDARRAVKSAKGSADPEPLNAARQRVQRAKVALGERGPVWWADGSPDYNRRQVKNTPYWAWFEKHLDTPSQ
ncbi:hypothetical protein YA0721_23395 [Pseudomonas carnis]|uniref:hypothetical protein n=1 Tax=Pseudomonas carnis TaxID=2487355 RepID=UPI0018E5B63F|nr:hypothetical protein [Pseudomonas carnis]MBI6655596.1 hypothetical protein [Pseudomonas carnis]MBI6664016.1 hypothetical protein [Pseudomonas carnis]MBI6686646.1 hypothetical protein [Pseudomonas carnis]